jgi:hypothetical protein
MATVDTTHPDYDKHKCYWDRIEDVIEGQDKLHEKREAYLPCLKDQSDDDYKSYLQRAFLYNATARTLEGMKGLLFRKPTKIDYPAGMEDIIQDITLSGMSLEQFIKDIAEDAIAINNYGILVDIPDIKTEGLTQADVSRLNIRPYIREYDADSIINWRMGLVNNKYILTLAVLTENFEIQKNEFKSECETRYRVLDLFNGIYRQRVFRINDKNEDELITEIFPIMNGNYLTFIPFIFDSDIECPPLLDLANTNIAHYRVNADYEHGCHFTGLPTAVVAGYQKMDANEKLYIGSQSAWVFSDPQASAKFLEFTGQGLGALERNLDRKEQQMAVLGARMLAQDKKMAEAAETAIIRRAGENSILENISITLTEKINKALAILSEWAGFSTPATIEINRDFLGSQMTAQDITALVASWQAGAISRNTLFYNFQQGELYPDEMTIEDEQTAIDNAPIDFNI